MSELKTIEKVLFGVTGELHQIFEGSLEFYKANPDVSFKVRPAYGYNKFYLDWVGFSYDMSLKALIHFILYEKKYYKKILSKKTYGSLKKSIEENQSKKYCISDKLEHDVVTMIEKNAINYMKCCFESNNMDVSSFVECNYDSRSNVPNISKCNVIQNRIVHFKNFINELRIYTNKNTISKSDLKNLMDLSKNLEGIDYFLDLLELVYKQCAITSKEIIEIALSKSLKNSDLSRLVNFVNNKLKDDYLADRILRSIKQ